MVCVKHLWPFLLLVLGICFKVNGDLKYSLPEIDQRFVLKSFHNKYLSREQPLQQNNAALSAKINYTEDMDIFQIDKKIEKDVVTLKVVLGGNDSLIRYVALANDRGNLYLIQNRSVSERFTIELLGGNKIALNYDGVKYLTADENGDVKGTNHSLAYEIWTFEPAPDYLNKSCGVQGKCKVGEGDCDFDSDCLPGLVCKYDWDTLTKDNCERGPTTKDYKWTSWGAWSSCLANCSGKCDKRRRRTCIAPEDGGLECPSTTEAQEEKCGNDNRTVTIIIVVLAIVFGIIVLIGFLYIRHLKKQRKIQEENKHDSGELEKTKKRENKLGRTEQGGKGLLSGNANVKYNEPEQCKPIAINEFLNDIPLKPENHEFNDLNKMEQMSFVVSNKTSVGRSSDMALNRYQNIIPYDDSRVQLNKPINGSDYINASWITNSLSNNDVRTGGVSFIASQGPTKATSSEHLQMIYENNIDMIVMLTQCVEQTKLGSKVKCEQYWPDTIANEGTPLHKNYKHMRITNLSEVKKSTDLTERVLEVENMMRGKGKQHRVTQYHFTGWPDLHAPTSTKSIISLVQEVRRKLRTSNFREKSGCTILVHCSAGVGRTGTFIALYQIMEQLEDVFSFNNEQLKEMSKNNLEEYYSSKTIDIFNTVLELRSKRVLMVQSFSQYKYLYACVSSYAKQMRETMKPGGEEDIYVTEDGQTGLPEDIYVFVP